MSGDTGYAWVPPEESYAATGTWQPPGDFYSPITSTVDDRCYYRHRMSLPGVDLNTANQIALHRELRRRWQHPAWDRYSPENDQFGEPDAEWLSAILRWAAPARIVEVGSGWSTAVMVDTLGETTHIDCIEPYPSRLLELVGDAPNVTSHVATLQDTDPDIILSLDIGDVLFIDSSHVAKHGSDVNLLYLDIIPELPSGVLIHVHDIHWPFEYPKEWVNEGRSWNETYLLRALLINNPALEIILWPSFLENTTAAGSLWLCTR